MPSITSCSFVMGFSQASQISPSAGPPQNLGMLSHGRRPSLSFSRMRVRSARFNRVSRPQKLAIQSVPTTTEQRNLRLGYDFSARRSSFQSW
jgi:hypothetical protein